MSATFPQGLDCVQVIRKQHLAVDVERQRASHRENGLTKSRTNGWVGQERLMPVTMAKK